MGSEILTVSDWINLAIAIGTIGSCVVAVWLAYDSKRKKLDCIFVWRKIENYVPTLSINNICDKTIIIENIRFEFGKGRKIVGEIDLTLDSEYSEYSVVEAHSKTEIPFKSDVLFNGIKLDNNNDKKQKLSIIVKSTKGRTFKTSYWYSESDICRLFFWKGFFYAYKGCQ